MTSYISEFTSGIYESRLLGYYKRGHTSYQDMENVLKV